MTSMEFYKAIKAAGVEIPPRCHKVTIEAEAKGNLTIRFDCFDDGKTGNVVGEVLKAQVDGKPVTIDIANFESR